MNEKMNKPNNFISPYTKLTHQIRTMEAAQRRNRRKAGAGP